MFLRCQTVARDTCWTCNLKGGEDKCRIQDQEGMEREVEEQKGQRATLVVLDGCCDQCRGCVEKMCNGESQHIRLAATTPRVSLLTPVCH